MVFLPGKAVPFSWEGLQQGQLWLLRWEKRKWGSLLLPQIKTFVRSATSPTWLGPVAVTLLFCKLLPAQLWVGNDEKPAVAPGTKLGRTNAGVCLPQSWF